MSTEDTVKSFGAAFAFSGVVWLVELISGALASLQLSTMSALFAGPQALVTVGVAAVLAAIDFLFGLDLLGKVAGGFTVFFGIQALISLLTLCVFYAIVRISPKGTYTLSDCVIAAGVCLLEAAPFISTFVFWGMFAAYLRRRQISEVASMLPQTRALSAASKGFQALGGGKGGGAGGWLGKVGSFFNR